MLSVLKTQVRHKLALKNVFSSSVVDQSLKAAIHAQLFSLFKSQMAAFNGEEVQKHCNRTNDVRTRSLGASKIFVFQINSF